MMWATSGGPRACNSRLKHLFQIAVVFSPKRDGVPLCVASQFKKVSILSDTHLRQVLLRAPDVCKIAKFTIRCIWEQGIVAGERCCLKALPTSINEAVGAFSKERRPLLRIKILR